MDLNKILVVDQDEANRQFLGQMLQKKNYAVHHASTGTEGIHQAAEIGPDLIVFDSNLPDMPALTFIQQLKQNQHIAAIPCVVLLSFSGGWGSRSYHSGDGMLRPPAHSWKVSCMCPRWREVWSITCSRHQRRATVRPEV